MSTFALYSLIDGRNVATHPFEDPRDAAAYRERLQRQLGEPLGSLIPLNPEADAAHVRLMVDRHRQRVAEGLA